MAPILTGLTVHVSVVGNVTAPKFLEPIFVAGERSTDVTNEATFE